MKLYDVIEEDNTYEDGSECRSIGIFDTEHEANQLCEKMVTSSMYDSRESKRYYVRERELNESKIKVDIPKEGWVVLKLRYRYTGGNTTDPIHYVIICEWFLNKTPPDENLTSDCVISFLEVIANESREDFEQRRSEKFHEMWKMLNCIRREKNLVTLPFSITC